MHTRSSGLAVLAAAVSLAVLFGCKGKEGQAGATTGASTTAMAPPAAPATTMTDGNIVALFDEANIGDSTLGAMALRKATRANVKAFARLMMGEHHALRVKGLQLARKPTGALPPWPKAEPPANDPFKAAVDDEKNAISSTPKGPAFDSTYIANEIGIHQAVMDWATKAEAQAQNADLKGLIKSAGPVIKRHLYRAQEIAKKPAATNATKTKTKTKTTKTKAR